MAEDKEPGFYWLKQGDEWIIAKLDKNPFESDEFVWHITGDDNDWDQPPGEVGPMIEPPVWMVSRQDGVMVGPFTKAEAIVYMARNPGSSVEKSR